MKRLGVTLLGVVVALALSACADPSGGDKDSGPPSDSVQSDSSPDGPICEIEPTLVSLKEHYFAASCSFDSCHGSKKAGGLDLTGDLHADLVNVSAVAATNKDLVVPGDPDASFLLQKVEGPAPGEGDIMPLGAPEPMDPGCRIKMLRQWIADGANP